MKNLIKKMISAFLVTLLAAATLCPNAFALDQNKTQWHTFRGNDDNNGIVNAPTPKSADEAVLYWAKKLGEGFDDSATGCPIIVDDELVLTAKDSIFKVNKTTGDVTAYGTMAGRSAFNIIPPLYAQGMIFVGLADGRVQAFDAKSLKSLWIYQDALKGQPNCPIAYCDGKIYTGFWNGETDEANFVCLNIEDEDVQSSDEEKYAEWVYTCKGGFYWAGAYASENFVLVGTDDGCSGYLSDTSSLLSLNPKNGSVTDRIDNLDGDIRSSVCYDRVTDKYYFTSKGGSFYGVSADKNGKLDNLVTIKLSNGSDKPYSPPMSTCTPVVHNGRAYVGVSGTSQFTMYSGHNITVIDLASQSIAYTVPTKGYPQTSGLLTTAYQNEDGFDYIYFIDNYTPGQIRVLKDKPGVTSVIDGVRESFFERGKIKYIDGCAPVLFTPCGGQAEYAICSPIADSDGTMYFKNDSAYMMALGSKALSLEVTAQPYRTDYLEGESFEPDGLSVKAYFANGTSKDVTDYVSFSKNSQILNADDTDITVYFKYAMYGDSLNAENGNSTGIEADVPEAYVDVNVEQGTIGDVNGDGKIDVTDATLVQKQCVEMLEFSTSQRLCADVNKDGIINITDATLVQKYCAEIIDRFN